MSSPAFITVVCLCAFALPSFAAEDPPKPPAATDFKGLSLYLPFDDAGEIADVVSKRKPQVAVNVARVDGVRGKAVRLPHPGGDALPLIDLLPFRHLLSRPLGRGFTIAGWVRPGDGTAMAFLADKPGYNAGVPLFWLQTSNKIAVNVFAHLKLDMARVATEPKAPDPPNGWVHLALTWDGRDQALAYVDGQPARWVADTRGGKKYDLSWLPIDRFGLGATTAITGEVTPASRFGGGGRPKAASVDVDEFCLFSRALTPDEVKALAGRGPVPPQDKVNPDPILEPHLTPPTPPQPGPPDGTVAWSKTAAVWPFTDAVFDPSRKVLWTVGPDRPGDSLERGVLRRYAYPGFEPKGAYPLMGPAYRIALDSRRSRIAMAFNASETLQKSGPPWSPWDGCRGPVHVFEFDDLPYNPAAPPPLKPWRILVDDATVEDMAFAPDGNGLFILTGKLDPKTNAILHRYGIGGSKTTVVAIPEVRGHKLAIRPGGKGLLCFGEYQSEAGPDRPASWPLLQIDSDGKATAAGTIAPAPLWLGQSDLSLEGDDTIWVLGEKGPTRYKRPKPGDSTWVNDGSVHSPHTPLTFFFVTPQRTQLVFGWGQGVSSQTFLRSAPPTDPLSKTIGPFTDPKDDHQRGYAWPTPDGKYLLYRNGGVYELPTDKAP